MQIIIVFYKSLPEIYPRFYNFRKKLDKSVTLIYV